MSDFEYETTDRDDREQWLQNPITRAFLTSINRHRADQAAQALDAVMGGDIGNPDLAALGGELRALDWTLALAHTDTTWIKPT